MPHLERLQEGVEIDEYDLRQVVLPRVDEEEHVGDAQEGQENQGGLDRLPRGVTGRQSWSEPTLALTQVLSKLPG